MHHQTNEEQTVDELTDPETDDARTQRESEEGDDNGRNRFRVAIESIRRHLLNTIDISHGLLHELRNVNLLSFQQLEAIKWKTSDAEKVDQLLDALFKNISNENQQTFFMVLQKTQQSHVIEQFFEAFDQRNAECNDVGMNERSQIPLLYCSEFQLMDTNWCMLIDYMDSTNGLLDELVQCECINFKHLEDIESTRLNSAKNEKLLRIFRRKSCGDFYKLLDCLKATKQQHVVSLLQPPDTAGLEKPLNEEQQRVLLVNYETLVRLLESKTSGLLTEMLAAGIITYRHKESVETAQQESEANKKLLNIVLHGSEENFNRFLVCLDRINQSHISKLLVEDGALSVSLVVTHEVLKATKQHEKVLVQKIMDLLQSASDQLLNDQGFNIINYVKSRLAVKSSGLSSNIELIAAKTGNSIVMFYKCYSLSDLHDLLELHSTGELSILTGKMFKELHSDYDLTIRQITWTMNEYSERARFLYALSGLPVLSEIHLLAASRNWTKDEMNNVCFIEFPHELVELVLTKATGQLFRFLRRLTSRAAICSLVSFFSVSRYWWSTLTYHRSRYRRILRKYFTRTRYPFLPDCPKLKMKLNVETVYGITLTEGKLYVLGYGPCPIKVFSTAEPYEHLEDVTIAGLVAGVDIVACFISGSLYVADYLEHCIWQVSLNAVNTVKKFITLSSAPWTLSLNNQRLLVTLESANVLELYDENGHQLKRIELPVVDAYHAFETSRKTIVVCHKTRLVTGHKAGSTWCDNLCSVTEYSDDGNTVLRMYNVQHAQIINNGDPFQSTSFYLSVGPNETILLADRSTSQIIVLNSQLQFEYVLLCGTVSHPKRLSYNENTRKLCIGCYDTNDVILYNA